MLWTSAQRMILLISTTNRAHSEFPPERNTPKASATWPLSQEIREQWNLADITADTWNSQLSQIEKRYHHILIILQTYRMSKTNRFRRNKISLMVRNDFSDPS